MKTAKIEKKHLYMHYIIGSAIIVLLVAILCTGVYAYLKWNADASNNFTSAKSVNPQIQETFEDNLKTDVFVDVGETEYSVYVRSAVIAVWKDADGNILPTTPNNGTDYSISFNTDDWFLYNEYYYYKFPVESGNSTENLINECKLLVTPPDACTLEVKILAQTIQVAGTTDQDDIPAVVDAWGISVNSDTKQLEEPLEP